MRKRESGTDFFHHRIPGAGCRRPFFAGAKIPATFLERGVAKNAAARRGGSSRNTVAAGVAAAQFEPSEWAGAARHLFFAHAVCTDFQPVLWAGQFSGAPPACLSHGMALPCGARRHLYAGRQCLFACLFFHVRHRGHFSWPERQRGGNCPGPARAPAGAVPSPELGRLFGRQNAVCGVAGAAPGGSLRRGGRVAAFDSRFLFQTVAGAVFGGGVRWNPGAKCFCALQVGGHGVYFAAAPAPSPDAAGGTDHCL